ncbi:sensor histidine kinase [Radiobacillus kanasensis]|uniref:sensor histidine kinase n=1 Tax=Radiobacillus kanasensis TaxID=2844358 RepID=UPI001E5CB1E0|nr:sensor histidine kinase [Radiobacillus kanasensis]UFT98689.1 sensor histidine kinase [Radiobacillus kanasensis]
MSLKYKMIILFLLVILIPLNLLGMITYVQYSHTLKNQTYNYSTQIINQINQNIDQYVNELHRMTLLPLYDQEVLDILKRHKSDETYYYPYNSEIEKMNSFISTLKYKRQEIKGIQILTNNHSIFSNLGSSRLQPRSFNLEEESWYKEVKRADGESIIIAAHAPSYYIASNEKVFSVAKVLRDLTTHEHIGIIKIDIHLEYLQSLMEETHFSDDAMTIILDKQGNLIYQQIGDVYQHHPNNRAVINEEANLDLIREATNNLLNKIENSDDKTISYNGINYLPITENPSHSDIQSVVLIPEEEMLEESKNLRIFSIILIFIFVVITVILALLVTRKITSPIYDLRNKMVLAEEGNFNQQVAVHSNDEIGELSQGFNRMMEQINQLVKQVYQTELREKDAEIKALQSQINPHFIYNTLESINMMAITHGKYEISDMVSSLGKLIRYTVSQKESVIDVSEELEFVQSYLNIQQLRYEDRLEVEVHIPSHLWKAKIPKLTLQPILENAIVHGLDNGNTSGKISIDGWVENQIFYIRVSDNGEGMSKEQQQQLMNKLNAIEVEEGIGMNKHSGVALKNVHERIKLLFGKKFGLHIDSNIEQGTDVFIALPYKKRGE